MRPGRRAESWLASFRDNMSLEQKFHSRVKLWNEIAMQAAIDRVMQTYTTIVNLNPDEERAARQRVTDHSAGKPKPMNRHSPLKACDICEASENRNQDNRISDTFERKVISPAEREARKAFREVDAAKAMTENERAQKAFHENRERLKALRLARETGRLLPQN
jgi:hypothetical protein